MSASIRMGEVFGLSVMKFTLVFDGELRANGSPEKKQAIRDKFHPQLEDLWAHHPCLQTIRGRRYVTLGEGGFMWFETHHSAPVTEAKIPRKQTVMGNGGPVDYVDLLEPVTKNGVEFLPLVRERTALKCALKVTFLRHEEPGRIYQGGDIDNRLKTLLDALAVPQHNEQVIPGTTSPTYCLLEDDSLVMGLDIQTQRLLAKPNASKHDVHLLIEADIRVTNPKGYNQMFLGD